MSSTTPIPKRYAYMSVLELIEELEAAHEHLSEVNAKFIELEFEHDSLLEDLDMAGIDMDFIRGVV